MTKVLKALCVFFVLPVIFLCGCSGEQEKTSTVVTDFSADFSADYSGLNVIGKITATRQGMVNVSIAEPDTLNGLCVSFKNAEVQLRRDSLLCTADEAYLPKNSFPAAIKELLKAVASGVSAGNLSISDNTTALDTPIGECVLTLDSEGKIISAVCGSANLSIEFSNISPLGD